MSQVTDNAYLDKRIARTKTIIEKLEDAIEAIAMGAQQYSLDTGQTRQTVTRANIASVKNTLDMMEGRLTSLEARRCRTGTFYVRPGF